MSDTTTTTTTPAAWSPTTLTTHSTHSTHCQQSGRPRPLHRRPDHRRCAARWAAVGVIAAVALSGCGNPTASTALGGGDHPAPLLLSGPRTDVVVTIPTGWHQVIDSANPAIPEMVAPTTCMGTAEVTCATGLGRLATVTATDPQAAENAVEQAIVAAPGVSMGATLSQGPGKVGKRDGYRHRFTFSNPQVSLTAEIAAVASGPTAPTPTGEHEYSVVLVWVTNKPDAPSTTVIDDILDSTKVAGGQQPTN